jgi:hypothetical protein
MPSGRRFQQGSREGRRLAKFTAGGARPERTAPLGADSQAFPHHHLDAAIRD